MSFLTDAIQKDFMPKFNFLSCIRIPESHHLSPHSQQVILLLKSRKTKEEMILAN